MGIAELEVGQTAEMGKAIDYYTIIQVDPRADKEVIDAAYRRLAAKYHPDVDPSPGATERMRLLNAAYEVLSNPQKRRAYDLQRGALPPGRPASGPAAPPGVDLGEWLKTAALTFAMLLISAAVSRFSFRALILVGLLLAAGWLITASRKS